MTQPKPRRDWVLAAGLIISAASAAISSFAGLDALARAAGWDVRLAPMLPLTIDALAMSATRVWLADATMPLLRRVARRTALVAIFASLLGNATYHVIAAGLIRMSWLVVVIVGAVPPLALGQVSHLAVLRRQTEPVLHAVPGTNTEPERRTAVRTTDELLQAARTADAAWRAAHDGRPITRDEIRKALKVSAARATELRRQLRAESQQPKEATPA